MWRIAVIALDGVLAYANALRTPFIYDDSIAIVGNANIRTLRLPDALFSARENPTAGRPLVNLSFALNYAVGGLNPFGYHLVNIGVHILCAVMLFAIARRALASDNVALAVALLWTVHPLNSEAVDYVTERSESLMALFFLSTLYCSIRAAAAFAPRASPRNETSRVNTSVRRAAEESPRDAAKERSTKAGRLWTAVAVAACAAGMACKETMVVAPLVVVLYDRAFVFDSWSGAFHRRWPLYAGLAATWALLALFLSSGPRVHSAGFTSGFSAWTYL